MREAISIFIVVLLLPVIGYIAYKSYNRLDSQAKILDDFVECLEEKRFVDARDNLYYSCIDDYNLFVTDLPILDYPYNIDVEVQNLNSSGCVVHIHLIVYDDIFKPSERDYSIPITYINYQRGNRLITDVSGRGYIGTYRFKDSFRGQFYSIKDNSRVESRGGWYDYILKKRGTNKSVVAVFGENEYYLYKVSNNYLKQTDDYRKYNLK